MRYQQLPSTLRTPAVIPQLHNLPETWFASTDYNPLLQLNPYWLQDSNITLLGKIFPHPSQISKADRDLLTYLMDNKELFDFNFIGRLATAQKERSIQTLHLLKFAHINLKDAVYESYTDFILHGASEVPDNTDEIMRFIMNGIGNLSADEVLEIAKIDIKHLKDAFKEMFRLRGDYNKNRFIGLVLQILLHQKPAHIPGLITTLNSLEPDHGNKVINFLTSANNTTEYATALNIATLQRQVVLNLKPDITLWLSLCTNAN